MSDALDPASNVYIQIRGAEVCIASSLVYDRPTMSVQSFLDSHGSGLAKVSWSQGWFSSITAAEFITKMAEKYRIRPAYILAVLQAEQGLVNDPTVRSASFDIISMPDRSTTQPPSPKAGYRVRRNGGYMDLKLGTNRVSDGNWWFAWSGDWKMVAAVGAGILGPDDWPSWDVRLFMGFANQVEQLGKITNRYFNEYYDAVAAGNQAARSVKLDDGRVVICGDVETYALLRWTPYASVLADRPAIAKSYVV